MAKAITLFCTLIWFALSLSQAQAGGPEKAFDGALGFGQYTQGGRGGKLLVVTSLADNPEHPEPGTLRHAVKQKGPRIIEFAVSGVIHLQDVLEITQDNVTINGQTSPYGIVVTGAQTSIKANQVILRYLRFRPGAEQGEGDALNARDRQHIIIDHCSLSWANDEVASFYNNQWFTLQNSIVSESLKEAGHHKGSHGYGGIWGGAKASFIRNLIAHHDSRNPRINGYRLKPPYSQSETLVDIRNNVFFNWGDNSGYGAEGGKFNLINNYYKPGPASEAEHFFQFWSSTDLPGTQAYVAGNVIHGKPEVESNNRLGLSVKNQNKMSQQEVEDVYSSALVNSPFEQPEGATLSANDAFDLLIVKADVGANQNAHGAFQDSVDMRLLNEVKRGEATFGNGLINTEHTVLGAGGWAAYALEFSAKTH
ncbi:pectate lyase C [Aestuariibacter sp. GS-14]|uniref:pectate lyase family protein n=1 Tax=Aestuariibacter sp. GS-14 TaxID=2590670 RepID=UPI00112895EB|nr:pectate lyase C [Aestuariibacter sp. GS-14]TPV57264.1 pectate lyase C [Aestuariibacter sp. GS-14]